MIMSPSKNSAINDFVISGGVEVLEGCVLAISTAAVKRTGRLVLLS
jgi:hypothetical protein